MDDNFALGLMVGSVTGFIVAGFVVIALKKIGDYCKKVTAIVKPQDVKSSTDKAPWEVLVDGCKSLLLLIILIIFILVGTCFFGSASAFGWERVMTFVRSVTQP
jgi:hypothetical protein